MKRSVSLIAAGLLLAQPTFAADLPSKAQQNRQLHEFIFKNYPPRALAAGEQGSVFFVVKLDKEAQPTSCDVTQGSGHPLLDAETCALIVQYAVFSAARDANGRIVKDTAEGVVNWTIPGLAPPPVQPALLAQATKPEKQICRKSLRTGSLSAYERTCMTPTEWAKQSDQTKQTYEDSQGRKGSSVCTKSGSASLMDNGIGAAAPPAC
jgi:protein TonB